MLSRLHSLTNREGVNLSLLGALYVITHDLILVLVLKVTLVYMYSLKAHPWCWSETFRSVSQEIKAALKKILNGYTLEIDTCPCDDSHLSDPEPSLDSQAATGM